MAYEIFLNKDLIMVSPNAKAGMSKDVCRCCGQQSNDLGSTIFCGYTSGQTKCYGAYMKSTLANPYVPTTNEHFCHGSYWKNLGPSRSTIGLCSFLFDKSNKECGTIADYECVPATSEKGGIHTLQNDVGKTKVFRCGVHKGRCCALISKSSIVNGICMDCQGSGLVQLFTSISICYCKEPPKK